eukprot:7382672-Prymnesium_polylepis.1
MARSSVRDPGAPQGEACSGNLRRAGHTVRRGVADDGPRAPGDIAWPCSSPTSTMATSRPSSGGSAAAS